MLTDLDQALLAAVCLKGGDSTSALKVCENALRMYPGNKRLLHMAELARSAEAAGCAAEPALPSLDTFPALEVLRRGLGQEDRDVGLLDVLLASRFPH